MNWELLPGEVIIARESDDKFILSNVRVLVKEEAAFKSIALEDIDSMKIIREKSKGILIAAIGAACFAACLLFFGDPTNRESAGIALVFGIVGVLRYYTVSKRSLEFTLTNGIYTYRADNVLYGELYSLVKAIEKAIGKEDSTEVVDYTAKY